GSRTKIAVFTEDDTIDPIGSCIGQKGARIQTIINELAGEKIDIIEYDEDPIKFIGNSLLPAKITNIETKEEDKTAVVTVPEDQLSLTIGRAGQNVRLASKLTGWTINIKEAGSGKEIKQEEDKDASTEQAPASAGVTETAPTEEATEETKEVKEKKTKKATTKKKAAKKDKDDEEGSDSEEVEEKPKKKVAKKKKDDK
ncbi:transcription termination/antitermination protein NusA, partial [Candidatus Falkowbacteria bacterium]|nr:transcription termination/antitermination protein NusA [Candidatus Falkowbacteria bacterium]